MAARLFGAAHNHAVINNASRARQRGNGANKGGFNINRVL